jgi:hypothetical protein
MSSHCSNWMGAAIGRISDRLELTRQTCKGGGGGHHGGQGQTTLNQVRQHHSVLPGDDMANTSRST